MAAARLPAPPDADALIAALPAGVQSLARLGVQRRYRKGTLLAQEGEPGDTLFIVLTGRLRAFAASARGREITYGLYGPGDYLGEMILDGGPRSASIAAASASSCMVVTRSTVLDHLTQRPEFALELITRLIRRARAATLSARQLALNDVYGRLVALFESLAVAGEGGPQRLAEALTHRDMAERVGSSREMISRLMKDLEAGGHVRRDGKGSYAVNLPLPPRW